MCPIFQEAANIMYQEMTDSHEAKRMSNTVQISSYEPRFQKALR